MASLVYNSAPTDEANGAINFGSDTFWCMLVTSSYVPDKDAHLKRSDITNEVTGTGYSAGGEVAAVSVAKDLANDRVNITLGAVSWAAATISAAGAVYYKRRGGLASADELVAFIDFGDTIVSTAGTFSLSASTYRIQN